MNDASVDIGVVEQAGLPTGQEAIPIFGLVAFLDLNWSEKWTSTIGYSLQDNDVTNGQSDSSFKKGQYALTIFSGIQYQTFSSVRNFSGPSVTTTTMDSPLMTFGSRYRPVELQ